MHRQTDRQTDRRTDRNKLITITLSYRRALINNFSLSKTNSATESYFISQGIKLQTKTEHSKARNELNELTEWLKGYIIISVEKKI